MQILGAAAAAAGVAGTAVLGPLVFEQMKGSTSLLEVHEKSGSGGIGGEVVAAINSDAVEEEHLAENE